jgi:mannonate dehydratase
LFYSVEGYKKAMEEVAPSPNHGIDFCMGCFSETGMNVIDAIRYFGERGKIFYVHLRDVQGCVPSFQECFLGEGNFDPVEVVRTLKEVGFDGFIIDDHVPRMIDDTEWNHRGHAHATGYILGLVDAVYALA